MRTEKRGFGWFIACVFMLFVLPMLVAATCVGLFYSMEVAQHGAVNPTTNSRPANVMLVSATKSDARLQQIATQSFQARRTNLQQKPKPQMPTLPAFGQFGQNTNKPATAGGFSVIKQSQPKAQAAKPTPLPSQLLQKATTAFGNSPATPPQVESEFLDSSIFGSDPKPSHSEVLGLVKNPEDLEKIKDELANAVWQSSSARRALVKLLKPGVKVELQFAKLPVQQWDEIFADGTKISNQGQTGWTAKMSTVEKAKYETTIEQVLANSDAILAKKKSISVHQGNANTGKVNSTETHSLEIGATASSFLGSKFIETKNVEWIEGAEAAVSLNFLDQESATVDQTISFKTFSDPTEQQLPFLVNGKPLRTNSSNSESHTVRFAFSLEQEQFLFAGVKSESTEDNGLLAAISASRISPELDNESGLTYKKLMDIKSTLQLPKIEETTVAARQKSSKPIEFSLQFGSIEEQGGISTEFKLKNGSSLTVNGNVASQQIAKEQVQIAGSDLVFKNVSDESFMAQAATGFVTFKRNEPLETSVILSLQRAAKLKFAGIQIEADAIQGNSQWIEATNKVTIRIPEISTVITADRAGFNLETLSFDYFGNVSINRETTDELAFPIAIQSNQLRWSLVTGQMQTNFQSQSGNRLRNVPRWQLGANSANLQPVTLPKKSAPASSSFAPAPQPSPFRSTFGR